MPNGVIDKRGIGPNCLDQFGSGNALLNGQGKDVDDFFCFSAQYMVCSVSHPDVENNKVLVYRVNCKISFMVNR
jgi:hypothetical protein